MTVIGNYTNGEHLFLRTIGSTIGGEFVDTILFIGIAFVGTMPPVMLLGFILTQYVMKVLIETFLQPKHSCNLLLIKRFPGVVRITQVLIIEEKICK